MVVGQELQVGIVRGDHAKGLLLVELQEDGFGDGAAQLGLGAGAELVDEEEGLAIGMFQQ